MTLSWLLVGSWLGLELLGLKVLGLDLLDLKLLGLQLLGLEVVGGGEVGLQVCLHCWQVCELLPAIATLPPG